MGPLKNVKICYVPMCKNTSANTPSKIFITVPYKDLARRSLWFEAANITSSDYPCIAHPKILYFCEDHFQVDDFSNYHQFKASMADVIKLKPNVLPRYFECQKSRTFSMQKNIETPSSAKTLDQHKNIVAKTASKPTQSTITAFKPGVGGEGTIGSPSLDIKKVQQHLQVYDKIVAELFDSSNSSYLQNIYFLQEYIINIPIICTSLTEMTVSKNFNSDQWYNFETASFMACASSAGNRLPAFLYKEALTLGSMKRPDGMMKYEQMEKWLLHFVKHKTAGPVLLVMSSSAGNVMQNPSEKMNKLIKDAQISVYVSPQIGSYETNPLGLEVFEHFKDYFAKGVKEHCKQTNRRTIATEHLLTILTNNAWIDILPCTFTKSFQISGVCSRPEDRVVRASDLWNGKQKNASTEKDITMQSMISKSQRQASVIQATQVQNSTSVTNSTSVGATYGSAGSSDGFEMVFLPSHPEPEEAESTLELNEEIHLKDEITFKYESEMIQDEEYPSSCPTTPFHSSTAHSTNRLSALQLPVPCLVPVGSKSLVNTPPTIQQGIMSHTTPEPTVLRSFNIPYSPQQQTDLRNPNTNPTPLIVGRNNVSQSFGTSTSLKTCQTVTVPAISSMGSTIMRQTTSNFTTQPPSSMPIQRSEISSNIIINHGYGSSTQKTPLIPCHKKSSELGHGNIFNVIQSDKNVSDDTSFSFVPAQSVHNNNSTINTAASVIRQSRQTHQIISNVASSEKFKPLTQAVYKNISISCILCSKVCPCPEALRLHLSADHPQTIYKCSHCLTEFKESDIIWHLLSDHKCRYCGIESDHRTSLIHHLKSTHKTDSSFTFYGNVYHFSPVVTKVNKRLVANYQCDGCGQFFRNVNTCKNHQQKGCTLFICALCDNYFVTIARLTAHIMTSHLKRYKCTFKGCRQDYAFQQSLKLHHNLYHSFPLHLRTKKARKKKPVKPKIPQITESGRPLRRVVARNLEVAQVQKILKKSGDFTCDICGQIKHSRGRMNSHLWINHLSHESYVCITCQHDSKTFDKHKLHLKRSLKCWFFY